AKQNKRRTADLEVDDGQYHTENHRCEESLNECEDRHHRCFPTAVGVNEHNAQRSLPEHPEEKTSLLTVPDRRAAVVCRKAPSSGSKINGEPPILRSMTGSTTPRIIDARKA